MSPLALTLGERRLAGGDPFCIFVAGNGRLYSLLRVDRPGVLGLPFEHAGNYNQLPPPDYFHVCVHVEQHEDMTVYVETDEAGHSLVRQCRMLACAVWARM